MKIGRDIFFSVHSSDVLDAMNTKSSLASTISGIFAYITSLGGLAVSTIDWIDAHDKFCFVLLAIATFLMNWYYRRKDSLARAARIPNEQS